MPYKKASQWFEGLYHDNKNSQEKIPWAKQCANPMLLRYLQEHQPHKGKALVIGCGLGDDAHALVLAGHEVTAIDISQSALDMAKERFFDSQINFVKQDIFEYEEKFDLVFEAFTIQSLPRKFRGQMIEAIAKTVAKEGRLLIVAHQQTQIFEGPPWPLTQEEVESFSQHKLKMAFCEVVDIPSAISPKQFYACFER